MERQKRRETAVLLTLAISRDNATNVADSHPCVTVTVTGTEARSSPHLTMPHFPRLARPSLANRRQVVARPGEKAGTFECGFRRAQAGPDLETQCTAATWSTRVPSVLTAGGSYQARLLFSARCAARPERRPQAKNVRANGGSRQRVTAFNMPVVDGLGVQRAPPHLTQ